MSDEFLVRYCAPTLAGMKTGSVFRCAYTSRETILAQIRRLNQRLGSKGLRVIPLRFTVASVLVYVFRPEHLRRDLENDLAAGLLRQQGYTDLRAACCLTRLIHRLGSGGAFPHELGLFLGYPPEDVRGFMENKTAGYQCAGCWKVYGDAASAQRIFARYKKCTRVYWDRYAQGIGLERLTVAG